MPIPGLPFDHTIITATGIAANNPIVVPNIRADSVLLAVIMHDAANGVVEGLDPSDFTPGAGVIESTTVTTADHLVTVIYTDSEASS